jgi:hypothetical protein
LRIEDAVRDDFFAAGPKDCSDCILADDDFPDPSTSEVP